MYNRLSKPPLPLWYWLLRLGWSKKSSLMVFIDWKHTYADKLKGFKPLAYRWVLSWKWAEASCHWSA